VAGAHVDDVDDAIQSQIESSLKKNSVLAPRDIDVDVDHGVVTLTGKVRDTSEKTRAEGLAHVQGVTRVDNRIEIDPNVDASKTDAAAEKTKSGLSKAVDATKKAAQKSKEAVEKGVAKTEEGVGKGASKTASAVDKAGDKVSDASLTTSVKTKLSGDKLLTDSAIDVDTSNHVVTLRGTVPSEAAKTRAAEVASSTEHVTRVVNLLVVRGA